ncbi:PREDICTED: uncharacterized protein LOC109244631 [Nicotiana attenuata]|uniref:uncharacterized protein LOC109244631 n=1 Tax=Nicotiana attenuata TaxID=49451 RepID=UPI000905455B|nr:PREDICTED: uncharacterized protein LOC109244631 [Nicotiana attenuata]
MNGVVWNVRGMNKPFKQGKMCKYLKKFNIVFAALLETMMKEMNFAAGIARVAKGWTIANNYVEADNGRIWILWQQNHVNVTIIETNVQVIHCFLADRIGGQLVAEAETRAFQHTIDSLNLVDMKATGRFFTWNNGHKLKLCKEPLKQLMHGEMRSIDNKVKETRDILQHVQSLLTMQIDNTFLELEKPILRDINKWLALQEKILKQKSKAYLIAEGDGNNNYFFFYMKARASVNNIDVLKDDNGNLLRQHKDIERAFLQFYINLLGSAAESIPGVDMNKMRNGTSLSISQQQDLTREITDTEIKGALF